MTQNRISRYQTTARIIAQQSLAPKPGHVVVLCWADYADALFQPLKLVVEQLGAYVITQRWTDATLLGALRNWPREEVARLWMPMEPDGAIRLTNNRFLAANRVVGLWSPPVSESGEHQANALGLNTAIQAGTQKLGQLDSHAAAKLVLLEWPRGCRKDLTIDFSHDEVTTLYLDAMEQDAAVIGQTNSRILALVANTQTARLSCPLGTDLTFEIKGRTWRDESMEARQNTGPIYVPGGEVYVAVNEDRTDGQLVFSMAGQLCRLTIRKGLPVELTTPSLKLTELLSRQLALGIEPVSELGIGTNPGATALQIGSLCEKAYGTVHVAVGSNYHLGGQHCSTRHIDLLVQHPTLYTDGTCIVSNGRLN